MARLRASHLYLIMTLGALGGAAVTYLQWRRFWIAGLAGVSGAAIATGMVALMHRRYVRAEGSDEPATQTVLGEDARPVHWSKKVGVGLVAIGLADFLLAASRRDLVNAIFAIIFVMNGVFLVLRRAQ